MVQQSPIAVPPFQPAPIPALLPFTMDTNLFVIVDVHEHDDVFNYLNLMLRCQRQNLVTGSFLDYYINAWDNHIITVERKSWADFCQSIDSVESQIRKATRAADRIEVGLLLEGVAIPNPKDGCVDIYQQKTGRGGAQIFVHSRYSKLKYGHAMGKLWEFAKAGIDIYYSCNHMGSAYVIKEITRKSRNPEYETFKRYNRTKRIDWSPNPVIESLMGIRDEKGFVLGEKRAKSVFKAYGSMWNALHKSPEQVALETECSVNLWRRFQNAVKLDGRDAIQEP